MYLWFVTLKLISIIETNEYKEASGCFWKVIKDYHWTKSKNVSDTVKFWLAIILEEVHAAAYHALEDKYKKIGIEPMDQKLFLKESSKLEGSRTIKNKLPIQETLVSQTSVWHIQVTTPT